MKRFSMLSLSAVLALGVASISASAMAQQRVTRDQLVGTWTLVSCSFPDGRIAAFCVNPSGRQILEATGQYIHMIAARGRPKCGDACANGQVSGDQYKAIAQGVVSQFGTWSFDEADQTLTKTAETALYPDNEGRGVKWKVSLTGGELRLTAGRTDV
jgi:cytochrome c5